MSQHRNIILSDDNSKAPAENPDEPDNWQHVSEPAQRVVRRINLKFGPDHDYTQKQLALFAEYRGYREFHRPTACTGAALCWVEHGPRGWTTKARHGDGGCIACGGAPRFRAGQ